MVWRVAKSLNVLLGQINAVAPNRDKSSDGSIGDEAHSHTASDHNPNENGVVTARDFTHDPANGFDSWAFFERLRLGRDHRIKYAISNGRIFSSKVSPWETRRYSGSNAHAHHIHVSVMGDPSLYDDSTPWNIGAVPVTPPPAGVLFSVDGRMSTFGGPLDTGMSADEGLALFANEAQMRKYGLGDYLLPGSGGLGRRLNPAKPYIACRWPRELYETLRNQPVVVEAKGQQMEFRAVDFGPALWTGRVADLSPGGARALRLNTDDRCSVTLRKPK